MHITLTAASRQFDSNVDTLPASIRCPECGGDHRGEPQLRRDKGRKVWSDLAVFECQNPFCECNLWGICVEFPKRPALKSRRPRWRMEAELIAMQRDMRADLERDWLPTMPVAPLHETPVQSAIRRQYAADVYEFV